jgi:hypothetical protein
MNIEQLVLELGHPAVGRLGPAELTLALLPEVGLGGSPPLQFVDALVKQPVLPFGQTVLPEVPEHLAR